MRHQVLKDICPIPPLKDGAAKKLSSKLQSDCSIHSKAKVGPSKRPCPSRLYVPFLQVRSDLPQFQPKLLGIPVELFDIFNQPRIHDSLRNA